MLKSQGTENEIISHVREFQQFGMTSVMFVRRLHDTISGKKSKPAWTDSSHANNQQEHR